MFSPSQVKPAPAAITYPMSGSCNCGALTYQMLKPPLIISACHCTRCQKRTGAPFGINAYIEADQALITSQTTTPDLTFSPTPEYGDMISTRCPTCQVVLWYTFEAEGGHVKFVRVSTLNRARHMVPNVHIWTSSKVDWVMIPDDHLVFKEGYDDRFDGTRSPDSLKRESNFKSKQMEYFTRWMSGKKHKAEVEARKVVNGIAAVATTNTPAKVNGAAEAREMNGAIDVKKTNGTTSNGRVNGFSHSATQPAPRKGILKNVKFTK